MIIWSSVVGRGDRPVARLGEDGHLAADVRELGRVSDTLALDLQDRDLVQQLPAQPRSAPRRSSAVPRAGPRAPRPSGRTRPPSRPGESGGRAGPWDTRGYPRAPASTASRRRMCVRPRPGAQRTGQMHEGRVAADHQVEVLHDGRGIHERPVLAVDPVGQVHDREPIRHVANLLGSRPFLEADERDARQTGQRLELRPGGTSGGGRGRTWDFLARRRRSGTAPGDEAPGARTPPGRGRALQIGDCRGDGLERRAQDPRQAHQGSIHVEIGPESHHWAASWSMPGHDSKSGSNAFWQATITVPPRSLTRAA